MAQKDKSLWRLALLREELYSNVVDKMKESQKQEKISSKRPEVNEQRSVARKDVPKAKEVFWKILPCPECGSAPSGAGAGNMVRCSNSDCDYFNEALRVEVWNKDIRMPFLRPNQFNPPKPPQDRPWERTKRRVEIVEPPEQEADLDIEFMRRIKNIDIDEDE